jgi:hypothetical protein
MGKLIYAILFNQPPIERLSELLSGMKGIAEAELATVTCNQISAVVSHIERVDLITSQANALTFARVIEYLSQQFTLLPMRFGSIMDSTDAVTKMLERNYPEIQHNLGKIENKSEFGLKVFCDHEKLMTELIVKSEAATSPVVKPDTESKNSVFREYVNRKLKEHRLEALMLTYVDSVITLVTEHLAQLDAINKIQKMATISIIIDAVFLVEKERKSEVIQVVDDMQNQYPGLNFILTGPWPPYNFVDFIVK